MTLLYNYNLSDEILSNAKIQIVAIARAKQTTASVAPVSLRPSKISMI